MTRGPVHHLGVEPQHAAGLALLDHDLVAVEGHDPVVVGVPADHEVGGDGHGRHQQDEAEHPEGQAPGDAETAPALRRGSPSPCAWATRRARGGAAGPGSTCATAGPTPTRRCRGRTRRCAALLAEHRRARRRTRAAPRAPACRESERPGLPRAVDGTCLVASDSRSGGGARPHPRRPGASPGPAGLAVGSRRRLRRPRPAEATVMAAVLAPIGVNFEAASGPSSPTWTSTMTTVMLSAPPCSLATSTRRRGRLLGIVDLAEDVGHLVHADLVGQAVGAEQHPVARLELQLPHVGLDLGGHAEGAGEDVALGVDGRLGLGHLAVAHALLGQAVVGRDLDEPAVRVDVGPRVTHVGQGQDVMAVVAADERHRRQRRAHAAQVGVDLALVPDRGVRLGERRPQPRDRRGPLEGLVERLDGDPRRHLAADVAAHAVGHGVEVRAARAACPG